MNRHDRRATSKHNAPHLAPRVAICIPSMGTWCADTAVSLMGLAAFSAPHVGLIPINQKGSYIAFNRNMIAEVALDHAKADWLMWVDADMVVPPDTLMRLLAHDKDIIGCDYRKRLPPFQRIGEFVGDDPGVHGTGLHEMKMMPQGVLLVRAEVYRKLPHPWYRETFDGPRNLYFIGEDIIFTKDARSAGYKVWCDLDLTKRVSHIGERAVGYQEGGGVY